ncbi:MAG TPA: hypothetical protein VGO39_14595 [Gaiellaceae bacterium]|nr:hypothetical protein [Gaiellaceae bacterium]
MDSITREVISAIDDAVRRSRDDQQVIRELHDHLVRLWTRLEADRASGDSRLTGEATPLDRAGWLVDVLTPDLQTLSATLAAQVEANVEMRSRFLRQFGAFSGEDIGRLAGSRSARPGRLAASWAAQGKIFDLRAQGRRLYPQFQLDPAFGYAPRPIMAEVLHVLDDRLSGWDLALWFATPRGWLGGRRPVDLLGSGNEAEIVGAARHALDRAA